MNYSIPYYGGMYSGNYQNNFYRPQVSSYLTDQQQQQQTVIKGRPVASIEEARVSMIDFDGSVFYFPDVANQKIYTKQINLDGTASLKVYQLVENPQTNINNSSFELPDNLVTKEEFDKTVSQLLEEIKNLKQQAGGNTNDNSTNDDATYKF